MARNKRSVGKSGAVTCEMCGRMIPKKEAGITKRFDGIAYNFDSDNCLLIFSKLRELYGRHFFAPVE